MKRSISFLILGLLLSTSQAAAIPLDGGPSYSPPGAGIESTSGDAASFPGFFISYTGIDTTQTQNLYFGLRVDLYQNGYSMNGPSISGLEIFYYPFPGGSGVNTITYFGTTTLVTTAQGSFTTPIRMRLTFTAPGAPPGWMYIVEDTTTRGITSVNGEVGALFAIPMSGTQDFDVVVQIEAQVPPFDPNAGNWEPANDLFNRLETENSTATSFDWGFYWEDLPPEPVPGLGALGAALLVLALCFGGSLWLAQRRMKTD